MVDKASDDHYRWEAGCEKTWEAVEEDAQGSIDASIREILQRAKRERLLQRKGSQRLGIMRHVFVVLDLSKSMQMIDFQPSRLDVSLMVLEKFADSFFDQNPMAQLGLITTLDKRAEKVRGLSSNLRQFKSALKGLAETVGSGEPSLQNALDLGLQTLKALPSDRTSSREILVIMSSLTTCDPGNIESEIEILKAHKIRCSVIGLSAEVRILRYLCSETGGSYTVLVDRSHFEDALLSHTLPPKALKNAECTLIRMGFPVHHIASIKGPTSISKGSYNSPSMCICHNMSDSGGPPEASFTNSGYFCPQCKSKYCEIPVDCRICGLTLVSAAHLARSYHHLFPLPSFEERKMQDVEDKEFVCAGCSRSISEKGSCCTLCNSTFCEICDDFVHDTLHYCPGCAT